MALSGDEALVGRVLNGRYLIGERIARGGMASVFRATDQRLDREVAIKVMHHGLGDDQQFTQRFVREAKSAAKLNHPNVVSVFDQGMDGEVTYLVMEYVPGRTLRDIMREEAPMPPHRALELLEQILIALSAAHAARIIHRDVKPENVLITPDGEVKVADFGLARAVSAATTATGGTLIGTVSYLAPEIVTNDGADARSDVYACGAMLYEMLTGTKPHSGESPIQVAYKHVHEDIGAPSEVQPGIPPYVDALVARATVRDRDQRSTDARVMLQQVRSVQRAIDAGITDDPDLAADLRPGGRVPDDADSPTVSVPRRPMAASSAAESAPTESVPAAAAPMIPEPPEATVQWSSEGSSVFDQTPATPAREASRATGLHPAMSSEDYKLVGAGKGGSRRGRTLLIVAVVLALLAVLAGWYFAEGRYVDTPRLVGSTETQAVDEAKTAGFKLDITREFSETIPNGVVISTDPEGGKKILPSSTINAVVSKGKDRVKLPAGLKGMTVSAATAALTAVRLKIGKQPTKYDEKVDKGRVIGAVTYSDKSELKPDTVVDLYVSKGRKPIEVTNYEGRSLDDAKAGLEDAGFKLSVTEAFSDDVAKGIVISQSPKDGTKFKNAKITLTVSKGQDLVKVPNLIGHTKPYAEIVLTRAGFKMQVLSLGGDNFQIRGQTPSPGSRVKRGSTVTISQVPLP